MRGFESLPLRQMRPICYAHGCVDIGCSLSAIQVRNKQAADCVFSERRAFLFKRSLMNTEIEELFSSSYKTRKLLEQVLPAEAVDHILTLLAKDNAHRKYLKIVEENEQCCENTTLE